MADKELVRFETTVEKLVADFTRNVNDRIEDAKKAVDKDLLSLYTKIKALPVPKDSKEKDLNDILDAALQNETKRIVKLVEVVMTVKLDGGKLKSGTLALKGVLNAR